MQVQHLGEAVGPSLDIIQERGRQVSRSLNNEDFETQRYDQSLERLRRARLKSQSTLSLLNTGQIIFGIIVIGLIGLISDFAFKALNRRLFAWSSL